MIGAPTDVRLRLQRFDHPIHDPIEILTHVRGREPDDPEAFPGKDLVANEIMLCLTIVGVLESIDLDHQTPREARKVEEVAAERELPADRKASLAQSAQAGPEDDLWLAHVAAEFSGATDFGSHVLSCS
jgi:hypothetical protein